MGRAVTCPTTDVTEDMAGQTITIGGSIASARIIPTRKGDLMAAVKLEDLAGSIEVIVFPRTFQTHRELIQEDAIVLIRGKVDTRDDQPKLLCESVEAFEPQGEDLEDGPEEDDLRPVAPAQTAYPVGAVESAAGGFDESGGRVAGDDAGGAPAFEPALGDSPDEAESAEPPPLDAYEGERGHVPAPAAAGIPDGARFVLELLLERSMREERDVGRLVRLDELIGRHPGSDRVVLHILAMNGRDNTALELAERVDCCPDLVDGMVRELGEEFVRVRTAPAARAAPPALRDDADALVVDGGAWPPPVPREEAGVGIAVAGG